MASGFKMNPGWEEGINRQVLSEMQKLFDNAYDRYAGKPVTEVRAALRSEGITEPHLSALAETTSEGRRIRVKKAA